MLVMFSDNNVLLLAIVDKDLEKLKEGHTLEYINPPHGPQLIRDIVLLHAPDKEQLVASLRAAGVQVNDGMLQAYLRGGRTDRGFPKPS